MQRKFTIIHVRGAVTGHSGTPRRASWSGVGCIELTPPVIYIKQEIPVTMTLLHSALLETVGTIPDYFKGSVLMALVLVSGFQAVTLQE